MRVLLRACTVVAALPCVSGAVRQDSYREQAGQIPEFTAVQGGLIVHIGCGDGRLTAAFQADDRYFVQGLERDADRIGEAREHLQSSGIYGLVSVDVLKGNRLPHVDCLANLVVVEELAYISASEVMRIL